MRTFTLVQYKRTCLLPLTVNRLDGQNGRKQTRNNLATQKCNVSDIRKTSKQTNRVID